MHTHNNAETARCVTFLPSPVYLLDYGHDNDNDGDVALDVDKDDARFTGPPIFLHQEILRKMLHHRSLDGLGVRTNDFPDLLAVFEDEEGRHGSHAEFLGDCTFHTNGGPESAIQSFCIQQRNDGQDRFDEKMTYHLVADRRPSYRIARPDMCLRARRSWGR